MIYRMMLLALAVVTIAGPAAAQISDNQLDRLLKRFPQADSDGDGRLSIAEAMAFRDKMMGGRGNRQRGGVPREFSVDPGWEEDKFPSHAIAYKSPQEIADIYAESKSAGKHPVVSYPRPTDDSLRIVGTGHSFMAPGYKTFPLIARAAGLEQPEPLTHTGGGITGSARYKWEEENGIFEFDGRPVPKLLASIANAKWDAMVWGPYYNDRPEYYICWMDFCLKYNPDMKFFLSDAWPQLEQFSEPPRSEAELTPEKFVQLAEERASMNQELMDGLNEKYPGKVFVLPTCEAMVLAVKYYHEGKLPGVEGIHTAVGNKERSLWRDKLGHLGPGLGNLEGYVFYATIYGRSPELIEAGNPVNQTGYPSPELDRQFRKIAWQAALNNPLSGIKDEDQDGVDDRQQVVAAGK